MKRTLRPELLTALTAHAIGYTLSLWVAIVNAPRTSELATFPREAIARGLVADGFIAWWHRAGPRFAVGVLALVVLSSLFGSAARLAIVRAGVFGVSPSAAFTHALHVLPRTLLARLIVLCATSVLLVIALAPLGIIAMLWRDPVNVRMHDLTILGLLTLPLITLFVAHMIDDLTHVAIIVDGKRLLEAVVLAVRSLHRRAVYGAIGAGLFVLGARVVVAKIALFVQNGALVSLFSFSLLGIVALVRARLLIHYAAEAQRFR